MPWRMSSPAWRPILFRSSSETDSGNIRNRSRSGSARNVPLEKDPANLASTCMPWAEM